MRTGPSGRTAARPVGRSGPERSGGAAGSRTGRRRDGAGGDPYARTSTRTGPPGGAGAPTAVTAGGGIAARAAALRVTPGRAPARGRPAGTTRMSEVTGFPLSLSRLEVNFTSANGSCPGPRRRVGGRTRAATACRRRRGSRPSEADQAGWRSSAHPGPETRGRGSRWERAHRRVRPGVPDRWRVGGRAAHGPGSAGPPRRPQRRSGRRPATRERGAGTGAGTAAPSAGTMPARPPARGSARAAPGLVPRARRR